MSSSCSGSVTTTYLSSTNYNAGGMPTKLVLGNGLNQDYAYRASDLKLTDIEAYFSGNPKLIDYSYSYDNGWNIDQIADAVSSETATLTYDHLDRLDTVSGIGSRRDA